MKIKVALFSLTNNPSKTPFFETVIRTNLIFYLNFIYYEMQFLFKLYFLRLTFFLLFFAPFPPCTNSSSPRTSDHRLARKSIAKFFHNRPRRRRVAEFELFGQLRWVKSAYKSLGILERKFFLWKTQTTLNFWMLLGRVCFQFLRILWTVTKSKVLPKHLIDKVSSAGFLKIMEFSECERVVSFLKMICACNCCIAHVF